MWQKITVEQYQAVHDISEQKLPEAEKVIQVISVLFNLTEAQINDLSINQFHAYSDAVATLFGQVPDQSPKRSVKAGKRRYRFSYDVGKNRFGQYAEVEHFLRQGIIPNLHLIAASISYPVFFDFKGKNDSKTHGKRAEDFKQANFLDTFNAVVFFCEAFQKFNKSYAGLLGIEEGEADPNEVVEPPHPFIRHYGWIYSATSIRDHEGVSLDDVWNLPTQQVFNGLSYLKAYGQYQEQLNRKARAEVNA